MCLLIAGCASRFQIERHYNSFLRRMPQINKVESGRVVDKGSFTATASASYSLKKPEIMQVSDSSFESKSSLFGDEITIISSSDAYCYESRIMVSGEGVYGFSDVISAGVSLDASIGKISGAPTSDQMTLFNHDIEGTMILKFAKRFGRIGVSIKPELTIVHLYGERLWFEVDSDSSKRTATERLSYYTLSVRNSSVIRYELTDHLAPFLGFQIKSQQFPLADENIDHEVCFGFYGGLDYVYKFLAITPFVAVPAGASISNYKSPVSAGLQLAIILKNGDQE